MIPNNNEIVVPIKYCTNDIVLIEKMTRYNSEHNSEKVT